VLSHTGDRVVVIENVLVGMFGAFIGGDFVAAQFNGGVINDKVFTLGGLALAAAGATLMLLALGLMRKVVGPMRNSKSRAQKR
jgi:uncharacterized membrane protein YeaQ/YmgE (transglycosylase-associated protein family)